MNRVVLQACWPWLVVLAILVAAAAVLVRLGGSRLRLSRLMELHADQDGGAQTLSFVLTLPVFVFFVLSIIVVSQITIGTMVVNYAAFAAARAAIVWIPATVGAEQANCIYGLDNSAVTSEAPVLTGGIVYPINATNPGVPQAFLGSVKYDKIRLAAALACAPICPSVGISPYSTQAMTAENTLSTETTQNIVTSAQSVYGPMTSSSANPAAIATRLQNKIAYALASAPANTNPDGTAGLMTWVGLQFYHPSIEPPLVEPPWPWPIPPLPGEPSQNYFSPGGYFQSNEVGWRDAVTVTVQHRMAIMAMLPGAGRLLSKYIHGLELVTLPDKTNIYVYSIQASATLGVEGEKSEETYVYTP